MQAGAVQAPDASLSGEARGRVPQRRAGFMQELVRSNDLVLLGAIGALLDAADIGHLVADQHMSVLEGSIGMLQRRLLVVDEDVPRALRLLREAGFGAALRDGG